MRIPSVTSKLKNTSPLQTMRIPSLASKLRSTSKSLKYLIPRLTYSRQTPTTPHPWGLHPNYKKLHIYWPSVDAARAWCPAIWIGTLFSLPLISSFQVFCKWKEQNIDLAISLFMVILFLNTKQFIKTHFEYWLSFNLQHLSKLVNNAIARSWSISTESSSFHPAFWCHLENNLEEQVIKGGT